jgi:hypothetical protein
MTKDEAVSLAQAFVKYKYPLVPPVTGVYHTTERQVGYRRRLYIETWMRFGGSTEMRRSVSLLDRDDVTSADALANVAGAVAENWLVFFFMSWDTDAAGMPQTLYVGVDDCDGSVIQLSPE